MTDSTTDPWPFWWRRMRGREGRRVAADLDYRSGKGNPRYPLPTLRLPLFSLEDQAESSDTPETTVSLRKNAARAAIIATALVATPALAGGYSGGTNWGAVVGAGILGLELGAATAPAPQPQIVVVQPQPIYVAPPQPVYEQRVWWCEAGTTGPRCFSTVHGAHPGVKAQ